VVEGEGQEIQEAVMRASEELPRLKAAALPRMSWQEVFVLKIGAVMAEEDAKTLTEYFAHFTSSPDGNCVCCDAKICVEDMSRTAWKYREREVARKTSGRRYPANMGGR